MRATAATILLLGCTMLTPLAVRAQEAVSDATPVAVPTDVATNTQTYPAEYFTRFTPRTALDMLSQVPGFVLRDDAEGRGLGQASANVLVGGQRLTGKSEDSFTQLGRIAAKNVLRIDIVDAATLDVPGLTGQVANVIVKSGGLTGNFTWRGEARSHFTQPMWGRADASLSGKLGKVDFTVSLANRSNRGGAGGETLILGPTGQLLERRDDVVLADYDAPKATLALKYKADGGLTANFNASYFHDFFRFSVDDTRQRPGGIDRAREYRERDEETNYELGGDLALKVGPGTLKLIGLVRGESTTSYSQSIFRYADASPATGDRYEGDPVEAERIARAEYGWKLDGADWQLSAEAAFNRLDTTARLFALDPQGQFTPIPFPEGSGGVKEARYETVLSYSRKLSPKLSLQLTVGGEFSRLTQSGATAAQREFWRPKGSLSLAWVPHKGLDVSFKLRRKVGQLDFGDFLAQVFLDNQNQNAGNADLVPPQSWELELELKQALGKWGSTTLRLFDSRIEDIVDIIPIGTSGESPGNLPKAHSSGLDWNSTFELAALGVPGAKLDARFHFERSSVKDPLTGITRPISYTQDRGVELEFRHDIPKTQWAWGVNFEYYRQTLGYRLTEVGLDSEGPSWMGIFVEHKDVAGLTVRVAVNNVLGGRGRLNRTVWDGFRDRSPVLFSEHRSRLIGPIFALQVKGSF